MEILTNLPSAPELRSGHCTTTTAWDQFTGGDPGVAASLAKLYADRSNWPKDFKKSYRDAVDRFLCEAAKGLEKALV